MANWFQKQISKLDFWDKDENARQREQFKREDEEEKRRRQNTPTVVRPGAIVQPTNVVNDTPLKVSNSPVFSQSDFVIKKPGALDLPLIADKRTPEEKIAQKAQNDKTAQGRAEIDRMTQEEIPKARDEVKNRTSWFDRKVMDRNWYKDVEQTARQRATMKYQEKYGYNKQPEVMESMEKSKKLLEEGAKPSTSAIIAPVISTGRVGTGIVEGAAGTFDLLTPGKGQNRLTKSTTAKAQEIDKLAKDLGIEDEYKAGNVVGEVASYFTPGLFTKGGKVAGMANKATSKVDEILRVAQKTPRLRKFLQEGAEELLDPNNIAKEVELTSRYLGQDSARGEDISATVVGENVAQSVGGAFLPAFARRGLKKIRGGKQAANATEEVVDDAVISVTGGGTNQAIDSAANKIDDAVDAPGSLKKAEDAASQVDDVITDKPPSIEVTDGVKSTNVAKPNPDMPKAPAPAVFNPNVPNPATDPIALAKAVPGTSASLAKPAPITAAADINAPLQKAMPDEAIAPPAVDVPTQVDEAGNPALISDAQAAKELADNGLAPQPAPSMVDELETERARARAEAEAAQVNRPAAPASFAPIDETTTAKMDALFDEADQVPVPEGNTRLYQTNDNADQMSDQFFKDPDVLANYINGRADNAQLRFVDVPNESVQATPGKPEVLRVAEPAPTPDSAILPESFTPAPAALNAPSPAPVVSDATQTGEMPSANTAVTDPSPTTGFDRTPPTVTEDVSAPRTREQILGRTSAETADDLMENAPRKETVNLEQAEMNADSRLRELHDEALVDTFRNGKAVDNPEDFYMSLHALDRLDRIDTAGLDDVARAKLDAAKRGAFESMAGYAEASGRGLRTVQVVFDKMPPTMKVEYLMKKLGTQLGDAEQGVREQLTTLVGIADNSTTNLRGLEDRAKATMESIENGSFRGTPEEVDAAKALRSEIKKARRDKELKAGDAYRFWQKHMPNDAVGKQAGQWGRTLMLSAPSGRIFDLFSTATTFLDDIVAGKVSAGIGKAVNWFKPGEVISKSGNTRELLSGTWEGLKDTGRAIVGKDRIDNFEGAAKRSSRGDTGSLDNPVANFIRGIVEAPTNLTRGQFNDKLYSQTLQDAQKRGLKGDDAKLHAALASAIPSEKQLRIAKQAHLRVNMLQDNPISRGLNKVANALDDNGKASWLTPVIRNQVAPFTSWLGGNLNRTLTDKNMLWNAGSIVREGLRGNTQGAIDSIAKLGVNAAETFAIGLTLTRAGIIVDHNETGDESDDYAGVYFKFGDRYIPVAIAGTMAVPLVMGNAVDKGLRAGEEGGDFMDVVATTVANNVVNLAKNTGVAGVLGGENNLQKNVAEIVRGNGDTPNEMLFDPLVKFAGNVTRQYIPGALADINSFLDQNDQLNPTNEAPLTKVEQEGSSKTDVVATEINKIKSRIPFLSQGLERETGKPAKDFTDRVLKSSRGTQEQEEQAVKQRGAKDIERELKKAGIKTTDEAAENAIEDGDFDTAKKIREYQMAKVEADENASEKDKARARDKFTETSLNAEGVATDDDGIKARAESGDYDMALAGMEYQYNKIKDDKNTPKSKKEKLETEMTRLEITRDGNFPPEVIALYNSISNSDWRNMTDPDHEDFNAERAGLLEAYDKAMAEKGVSRDDSNPKVPKYFAKNSARGGGGRGGRGKGDPRGSLNIFTNDESFSDYKGFKLEKATMAAPESAIPTIKKAPINDTSKLKKISVKRGSR